MPKSKHTGQSKGFAFLNVPAHNRDEMINIDGIETKIKPLKLILNIYLSLIKLQLDQGQLLIIILKTKICLFEIFQAIKAMLKLRFHQTVQGLPTMLLFLGGSIVNFSTKLKYNINRALTNGRARFKYFTGATSKELPHYIDATLEESNFEVAVVVWV